MAVLFAQGPRSRNWGNSHLIYTLLYAYPLPYKNNRFFRDGKKIKHLRINLSFC